MNLSMPHCFFIAVPVSDSAVSKHFKAMANHMIERGHQVVYISYGGEQREQADQGRLQIYSFPSPRPTKFADFVFLLRLVQQYKPDFMIANFGASNLMMLVGWLQRVPYRIHWYRTLSNQIELDNKLKYWKRKFLVARKKLIFAITTHIIANSLSTQQDLKHTFHISEGKTHVFHNVMLDPLTTMTLPPKGEPSYIVCVGRLDFSKGQDIVIRAVHILKQVGTTPTVYFFGNGSQMKSYRALAVELGVEEQCVFEGTVPNHQVLNRMAGSAFTLVPSRSEAFGMVNVESMSVGTPVIATAVGGIPELIRDGVDGFLVPPDHPEALAEKMQILYQNEPLRQQMGQNARQRFLERFEQKSGIKNQVQWFEELARRKESTE